MNRRTFLKSLAGLPFLSLVKPEDKFKQAQIDLIETIKEIEPYGKPFFDIVEDTRPKELTQWSGVYGMALWNGSVWQEIEKKL